MTQPSSIPPFPALRTAMVLTLLMVVAAATAAAVLLGVGLDGQVTAAILTAAVCLAAALAALGPVRRGSRVSLERTVMACLAGMAARMTLTLLGDIALVYALGLEVRPVAGWTMIWYLLLLAAEVTLLVRYFGSLPNASGAACANVSPAGGEVNPCSH